MPQDLYWKKRIYFRAMAPKYEGLLICIILLRIQMAFYKLQKSWIRIWISGSWMQNFCFRLFRVIFYIICSKVSAFLIWKTKTFRKTFVKNVLLLMFFFLFLNLPLKKNRLGGQKDGLRHMYVVQCTYAKALMVNSAFIQIHAWYKGPTNVKIFIAGVSFVFVGYSIRLLFLKSVERLEVIISEFSLNDS